MRIIEQRFLRCPNLFAATPCLAAVVEPGDARAAGTVAGGGGGGGGAAPGPYEDRACSCPSP
jgi:hypothetical protein